MTKIGFLSDLHIDANHFTTLEFDTLQQVITDQKLDHLHLAGDISNNLNDISLPFIKDMQKLLPVTYNLGNHDMLGLSEEQIQGHGPQIHEIGDTKLLALNGWYDYSFAPYFSVEKNRTNKEFYWFDRKLDRQGSDPEITERELTQLDQLLLKAGPVDIVSLHFVPHQDFLFDHPYFHRFNGFLGSQAFHRHFVKHQVPEVVFGHLHHRHSPRTIEGVRYHTRPLGYLREWRMVDQFFKDYPAYASHNTYRLSKRYNAIKDSQDFKQYKKQMLYQEFRDALTIIEK